MQGEFDLSRLQPCVEKSANTGHDLPQEIQLAGAAPTNFLLSLGVRRIGCAFIFPTLFGVVCRLLGSIPHFAKRVLDLTLHLLGGSMCLLFRVVRPLRYLAFRAATFSPRWFRAAPSFAVCSVTAEGSPACL
jgi:hypothetical protein